MSKIFVDMDGVLADFDAGLRQRGCKQDIKTYLTPFKERTPEQRQIARDVEECMKTKGFFKSLPMMEGADKLWKAIDTPYVLTALPALDCDKRVAEEKITWISKHFGKKATERVITCLRSEKQKYAFGNILIDDIKRNCDEWEAAGGKAILFVNYKQAIKELNELIN